MPNVCGCVHGLYMWTVLTYKAVLSNQLQGQLVCQHWRVAMGDIGEGPGMDKHWCTLKKKTGGTQVREELRKGEGQQFTPKAVYST